MVPRRASGHRRAVARDGPAHKEKPDDKKLSKRKRSLSPGDWNDRSCLGNECSYKWRKSLWGSTRDLWSSDGVPELWLDVVPELTDRSQGPCIGLRADDAFGQGPVDQVASGESQRTDGFPVIERCEMKKSHLPMLETWQLNPFLMCT
jgi:hypothetical protein